MGVPQNGWFIMENPKQKWMMTGGIPISGNPQYLDHMGTLSNDGFEEALWVLLFPQVSHRTPKAGTRAKVRFTRHFRHQGARKFLFNVSVVVNSQKLPSFIGKSHGLIMGFWAFPLIFQRTPYVFRGF